MKNVLVSVFILFALSLASYAQKTRNRGVLIDKSNPAVFVSFVQQKGIKDSGESKEQKYLLFKVTNNTRWKVWFDMSGANGKVFGDASLYYAIENPKTDENIRGSVFCHVCSNNPLSPGHSINFSIPAEEATIDARMRLIYRFDWENDLVSNNTHSVEYYFQELPSSVVNN